MTLAHWAEKTGGGLAHLYYKYPEAEHPAQGNGHTNGADAPKRWWKVRGCCPLFTCPANLIIDDGMTLPMS